MDTVGEGLRHGRTAQTALRQRCRLGRRTYQAGIGNAGEPSDRIGLALDRSDEQARRERGESTTPQPIVTATSDTRQASARLDRDAMVKRQYPHKNLTMREPSISTSKVLRDALAPSPTTSSAHQAHDRPPQRLASSDAMTDAAATRSRRLPVLSHSYTTCGSSFGTAL